MSFTMTMIFNGRPFELSFDEIKTKTGTKFFVQAKDENGNRYGFNMEENGEDWRIVNAPKVPEAIMQNQAILSDTIKSKM